jgi:uncharacterized protein (DUF952 family)
VRYTAAMSTIYHITTAEAWAEAQAAGAYRADSLATEGFIHLSTGEQLPWVAERFYRGRPGLLLLAVDAGRLAAELRYEESEPGRLFPHLYGPLNLDAVVAARPFPPNPDGSFDRPPGL